jgi:hypothetical protein
MSIGRRQGPASISTTSSASGTLAGRLVRALAGAAVFVQTLGGCAGQVGDTPPPPPGPRCEPQAGGPYWVEEGQPVGFTLSCKTGEPLGTFAELADAGTAVQLSPLPAGATFDAESGAFAWTPGLAQAAVYSLTATVGSESVAVKIGVADAFDALGNEPVADPLAYPEEMGLPVLFLAPGPTSADVYAPADVVFRGRRYAGNTEAKKRGAASLGYPKNSYTIEFDRSDPFDAPDLGFDARHKIVLISTFDDNAYVRQRLAYEVWNRMDPSHVQVETTSIVVYLDGAFYGLYTLADHVDDDLLQSFGMAKTVNVYKAINHDANFRLVKNGGGQKPTLHAGYEKKDGLPAEGQPGAFDDLDTLVMWAATASDQSFRAERADRLNVRDYEDWWIFVTLILADDSAGKNSYHAHDPGGGPFRYVPWDFNHAFGQTWQTAREAADIDEDYASMNRLFERFLADPQIAGPLRARYQSLLGGVLAVAEIQALVDIYVAEIDASARRDERRWGDAYRSYSGWSFRSDFTSYEQELAYLRGWIDDRWAFVGKSLGP